MRERKTEPNKCASNEQNYWRERGGGGNGPYQRYRNIGEGRGRRRQERKKNQSRDPSNLGTNPPTNISERMGLHLHMYACCSFFSSFPSFPLLLPPSHLQFTFYASSSPLHLSLRAISVIGANKPGSHKWQQQQQQRQQQRQQHRDRRAISNACLPACLHFSLASRVCISIT